MFVGRREELALLSKTFQSPRPQFVRVYGRRRIGKTELILQATRDRGPLYLTMIEADEPTQLARIAEEAGRWEGTRKSYRTWDDFFDHVEERGVKILVLDEFQHLLEQRTGFESILQARWDRSWQKRGPTVVVLGSSLGLMQRMTDRKGAPLFGRVTADLHLHPLGYGEVRGFYPKLSEEDKVRRFALLGGTPDYNARTLGKSLEQVLEEDLVNRTSPLLEEPQRLLRSEVQHLSRFQSILFEIGRGTHSLHELEQKVGVPHGGLGSYLAALVHDLDMVHVEAPVLGRGKTFQYVLSDPFLQFYYRFLVPNLDEIEQGRGQAVTSRIRRDLEDHVGHAFEEVARQAFLSLPPGSTLRGHAVDFREIGRWWNRRGEEIDLVVAGDKEAWFGEVKWSSRPVEADLVDRLVSKTDLIENLGGRAVRPFIVARGGATERTEAALRKLGGFVLTLEDLAAIFDYPTASVTSSPGTFSGRLFRGPTRGSRSGPAS